MGVPSFYRWLVDKYPKVLANAIEDTESLNTSLPNPNGIEFDNLYLDMNGIIHPCFHPHEEDHIISIPSTFEDVFNNMFGYIDRLFNIVRPRNLLYMAIDGVAPRAKMNQQRARRFRTSKDKKDAEDEELKVRRQFEMEGKPVLPKEEESEVSDSNIITPGTEFMHRLSEALKSYISSRLRSDLGWRDIKVILSDANVPGEGEHKIMSFIRQQRKLPSYNPNTRHCLYGLDADLIMLALATHELHFSILRENILVQEQNHVNDKPFRATSQSMAKSSPVQKSRGWFNNVPDSADKCQASLIARKPYQFLHVWILREYLDLDMRIADPPENFKHDLERMVDDFIFMCFFVGNDFLPHTPSLAIHERAIDLLMTVYKREMKKIGGYLIDMNRADDKKGGFIKKSRVQTFILFVGEYEEKIFKKRSELFERRLRKLCFQAVDQEDDNVTESSSCSLLYVQAQSKDSAIVSSGNVSFDSEEMLKNTNKLKEIIKRNLRRKSDLLNDGSFGVDKVRLCSPGFKERYYKVKFSAESPGEIESTRKRLVEKYTEGLLWVLLYYFSGPPSWTWFYPYHYGPFVSDLKGLSQVKPRFQKGVPFKPFDQLLSVLPQRSGHALPKLYRALMNDDSPIGDFYPNDFEIDVDGKRFSWQGICKLPFIYEERLLLETAKLEKDLGVEERERNSEKLDQLFVRSTHKLGSHILSFSKEQNQSAVKRGTSLSSEIGGVLWLHHEHTVLKEEEVHKGNEVVSVLCVYYEPPNCGPHTPRLLDHVECPEKTVGEDDLKDTPLWHESLGMKPLNKDTNTWQKFGNLSICGNLAAEIGNGNKSAGSGWGAGRGRVTNPFNYKSPICESSSGWEAGRGRETKLFNYKSPICKSSSGWGAGRGQASKLFNHESPIGESSQREFFGLNTCYNNNNGQFFSGSSSDQHFVHKGASSGRGAGRGKPNVNHSFNHGAVYSTNPNYASDSFCSTSGLNEWKVVHSSRDKGASSGRGAGRGKPNVNHSFNHGAVYSTNPNYASDSFCSTSGLNEWKVVHSSRDRGNTSMESKTFELYRTRGGVQQGNGSFWPSRNIAWCPSFRPDGGIGRGASRGRGQHDFRENNSSFAGNQWRQSYGRG